MRNIEADPLELDPETMRRLGYQVVDLLVERITTLENQPAWRGISRSELEPRLREPAPEAPTNFDQLLNRLRRDVLDYGVRVDHPRFFAFVPGSPTWPGILADFLAAGHQSFAGTWLGGAGVSMVELVVLRWFCDWLRLPQTSSGLLLSGGSAANLTALACARLNRLGDDFAGATIYVSSEAHSSVLRAARVLGFARERIRMVRVDPDYCLSVAELRAQITRDRDAGLRPFCLIANAGTTSTGAIDPLPELADIARSEDLWFHVDAAYGGFTILTSRGRRWLHGIEQADSVTLDPHKWLHQPFETGCLLVRDEAALARAFHVLPDYLRDTAVSSGEVNFGERGVQLTRAARALKIWLSVQYFGLAAFRRAIDHALDLTALAEQYIAESTELELLTPACLGIVCFRRRVPAGAGNPDEVNERLLKGLVDSGLAMLSSTRIAGSFALRLCVLNHRTTASDVNRTLEWLASAPV